MSYNLCMSREQIARCNTALGREALTRTTVRHTLPGNSVGYITEVVEISREGIQEVIAALKANPQDIGPKPDGDGILAWHNLNVLEECLFMTLQEPENDGVMHGICL